MIPISALLKSTEEADIDKCPFGLKHKCTECVAWQSVAFSTRWSSGFCLRLLPPGVEWDLAEPVDRPLTLKMMAENKG